MTRAEFNKQNIEQRYNLLKKEGEFIGSRLYLNYRIHLFSCRGLFIEMWVVIGIDQLQWIEVQTNQSVLDLYVDKIDLRKSLNL